jgi:hypothetical protein
MKGDLSGQAVEARLREASRLAGSLRPESRLDTKLDLSGAAVAARLKEASDLLDLCQQMACGRRIEGKFHTQWNG